MKKKILMATVAVAAAVLGLKMYTEGKKHSSDLDWGLDFTS